MISDAEHFYHVPVYVVVPSSEMRLLSPDAHILIGLFRLWLLSTLCVLDTHPLLDYNFQI